MSTPSLLYYLAHEFIAPVKRKGLFSGEYVLFAEYLSHAQLLYETSAVLGCNYRNRLETFAELFSEPGRQADLANFLITGTVVADRLAALPDEPKNFYELFFKPEFMKKAHDFGLTQFSELVSLPKLSRKVYMLKIPIKGAFEHIYDTALEGIQFGSQRPDLTEKLFSYKHDAEKWRFAREAGLENGSSPPETIPLRERQSEAKALIRPYVEKIRPDLIAKLGL